jgi:hypothetical protein
MTNKEGGTKDLDEILSKRENEETDEKSIEDYLR